MHLGRLIPSPARGRRFLGVRLMARTLLLGALATGALFAPASADALAGTFYPTQAMGDRGTDVSAIQLLLLDRGLSAPVDGVFGSATRDAVIAFQAAAGLTANGRVGPSTWARLVRSLKLGSTGLAVKALQLELHRKHGFAIPTLYGTFGTATRDAVIAFQRHMGLTVTGTATSSVWRQLVWHYERPVFRAGRLCDYSTGNGPANWGTAELIGSLKVMADRSRAAGLGPMSLGDVSLQHGGNISGHMTHEVGLDMDIMAIRRDRHGCWGTRWWSASYDRAATIALVKIIRATAPRHIKLIYFNDPALIRAGYTRYYVGHDDHMHVRFCETAHPDSRYVCAPAPNPSPTPTPTPSPTPTPTASLSPTPTPTPTPTVEPTQSPTPTPSPDASPSLDASSDPSPDPSA
jgi:peptidoglycan hydrolase-like protein with peptidoglycan-binding domain